MAKKKVSSDQLSVISEQKPAEYSVGVWSGQAHYQCDLCAFDALEKAAMLEHLVNAHNSEKALEELLGNNVAPPPAPPQMEEHHLERGEDVFEIELKEVDSAVERDGDEHKTFSVEE